MNSRRRYLTQADLEQYADIDVVDGEEGTDQINQAEELIDAYVGPQEKSFCHEILGIAQSGSTTGFKLQENQISYERDYLKYCEVEIMGGAGEGQIAQITGNDSEGNVTTTELQTPLATDSVYRIYQLAKFPRVKDARYINEGTVNQWFKKIPDAVKRATAAQLQFMIEMGPAYFASDASQKTSERIGDYSYSKGGTGVRHMNIAPKAKAYLRGIYNRTGQFE